MRKASDMGGMGLAVAILFVIPLWVLGGLLVGAKAGSAALKRVLSRKRRADD